jgi:hypothetical protein
MNAALRLNGVEVRWAAVEAAAIGDRIIALAQRRLDDADLAAWLRGL